MSEIELSNNFLSEFLDNLQQIYSNIQSYEPGDLVKQLEIKNSLESLTNNIENTNILKEISFISSIKDLLQKVIVKKNIEPELLFLNKFFSALTNIIKRQVDYKDFINSFNEFEDYQIDKIFSKEAFLNLLDKFNFIVEDEPNNIKNNIEKYDKIKIKLDELIDDPTLLTQFVNESMELLDNAQFSLVDLEYDPTNKSSIDNIFRAFHTIKGSSAFLGLKPIEMVSHSMEDLFSLIRDGKIKVSKELIDFIFIGINLLHTFIDAIKFSEYNSNALKQDLLKIKIDDYLFYIKKIKEEFQVKKIGEILEELGLIDKKKINYLLKIQSAENKKLGEILVEKNVVSEQQVSQALNLQQKQKEKAKKLSFVKVSNEKLNILIDTVGELVINQSILKQEILSIKGISDILERSLSQLEIITTGIKNLVLSMGMIPVSEIFNRLRVVARNTASSLGKSINLEIEGEDTELDRNIVEMLYDPLLHLVRNSIDHGIENFETRKKLGKPGVGKIFISASNKGSNIEIVVSDDGQGLNKQKIIEKVIEKGLLEKDKIQNLTEKEIYSFIFLPGFSTSETISNISGRGVGLDVVKKNIEQIHGRIDVQSEFNNFTKFIIRIPLTLAIIEGFVTKVRSNFYVFPFSQIEEILVLDNNNNKFSKNGEQEIFYHRGTHIPVLYTDKIFYDKNYADLFEKNDKRSFALIISLDQSRYCIVVDEVYGKQEIVIKNLGELLSDFNFFSGGTIFGDGTIGFVVDTQALIENYEINIK